jgi:hypothetical protein
VENNSGTAAQGALTDGFHLLIDAMKLNDLNTIYGVPGIPITDFGRMAQAAGIRVISFRHEQNAGNAAAIAGFLTKKTGSLPDRVGTWLSEWFDCAGACDNKLLANDPDFRIFGA